MKSTHRCPKCQFDRILYITQVADRYGRSQEGEMTAPMRVAHYQENLGSFLGMAATRSKSAG